MSNRLSKGRVRAGSFASDTSGGFLFAGDAVQKKVLAIPFVSTKTSAVDSGYTVPATAMITDAYIKITTASTAAGTVSVGLIATSSGDADGFIVTIGTSSTGVLYPGVTITAATSGDPVSGSSRGVLLCNYSTASTQDEFGNYMTKPFLTDSMLENKICYTFNSTSGTAGTIFFEYTQL